MRMLQALPVIFVSGLLAVAQARSSQGDAGFRVTPPLEKKVEHSDVENAIFRDGIGALSSKSIDELHIGFEEVLRDTIQSNPRNANPRFSAHLEGKTVHEILDALCSLDSRYTWSTDEASINVYPRATARDPIYLPNLELKNVKLVWVEDPDQALSVLIQQYPSEQVGYMQAGPGS